MHLFVKNINKFKFLIVYLITYLLVDMVGTNDDFCGSFCKLNQRRRLKRHTKKLRPGVNEMYLKINCINNIV